MSLVSRKQRIDYIDLAKGIAILLVIIGHTCGQEYTLFKNYIVTETSMDSIQQIIRGFIFSFHMPLFFIVSSMTFKPSTSLSQFKNKTRKAAIHLLIPVVLIFLVRTLIDIKTKFITFLNRRYFLNLIIGLIWSSGANYKIGEWPIYAIGMTWFFVALFFARTLFDYYQLLIKDQKRVVIISVLLSFLGFIVSKFIWLPLSFDIVLLIQPLFTFNKYIKDFLNITSVRQYYVLALLLFLWVASLFLQKEITHSYFELAIRRYPLYPVPLIGSLSATAVILFVCKKLEDFVAFKPLIFLGKNSMMMFVIHAFDYLIISLWCNPNNMIYTVLQRLCMDILLFIFLKKSTDLFLNRA